ncbi:EpsI family protein [Syntrophotalea acetylenivorans]|uniref:EpsI family protein n=1 Tax=Syntrophotalea acetylenivorans TaxID=1842532 RepID=A0A1L3GKM5_9BACT|nr:exosortase C-terminal domain/associated protein EpsI [Syntrophotalea acetylenivorans]APG26461.1 EpsI family protein [Syntrophotalea acetylenivorans]
MITKYRFFIVYALLIAAALFVHLHEDVAVPVNRPLAEIPHHQSDWRMTSQTRFDDRILEVLKPTDYLSRSYTDQKGNRVGFYLGYHGGGPDSGPIHSPKHCLPGSGWQELSAETGELTVDGANIHLVKAVYQNGYSNELFIYWFQVKGKSLVNEYALKIAEVTNSIFYNRKDSAFIRISVPVTEDLDKAVAVGERFVRDFYPHICSVLPK